jgi:hypothetical protein
VDPVENGPFRRSRVTSEQRDEGLYEAQASGHAAQHCVRILADGDGRPAVEFEENEHKSSNGETPGGDHEVSMPDEPLIKIAALVA